MGSKEGDGKMKAKTNFRRIIVNSIRLYFSPLTGAYRAVFGMDKKQPQTPDPNKCLVDIKLAGQIHSFFIDSSFVKSLRAALIVPSGFFEYKFRNGGYAINLAYVDYIEIFKDVYGILNSDVDGCSVFLAGKKESIKVGAVEATLEQICEMLLKEQFIHLGRYYFNRDKIALIVVQNDDKKSVI